MATLFANVDKKQDTPNLLVSHIIRYGPVRRLTSISCGELRPRLFFALWASKKAYYAVLAHFWPLLVFSITLCNFY